MSKDTMFIKPAQPGLKVHLEDKAKEFLPDEGAEVARSIYWVRRLNDGSVVEAKPARQNTSAPKQDKTSHKE